MIPQLAASIGPRFNRFPCYIQPKLNGVRCLCQIHGGVPVFMSRDEKLWHHPKLRHLVDEILALKHIIGDRILDGELYKHGWKLQRINGAVSVNSHTPRHDTHEVEYHIFDVVEPTLTFEERWVNKLAERRGAALGSSKIRFVPTSWVPDRETMETHFRAWTGEGYEGLMLRPDGPYVYGQTVHGTRKNSPYLWKYKSWQDDEFMCVGVTQGDGKASIGIGALLLGTKDGKPLIGANGKPASVGTGFDDSERVHYMQNPPIGKLVKVRYLDLTEDGIPFNPSFLCVME